MRKEKRKSATACLVAAVFLSAFFCQTTDALRLTKTARRDGRGATTVQEGKVLFGTEFDRKPDLASMVGKTSSSKVEDVGSYQADFAGTPTDSFAKEALWKQMSPLLQCTGDQMRFRAIGPGASQFALPQGNSVSLPLSNIPSNCGFNMQRNSIGLFMMVPYDGCNVINQGGQFALPLRWQGSPVLLLCAKPVAIPVSTRTHVMAAHPVYNPPIQSLPQVSPPQVSQVPVVDPAPQTRRILNQKTPDVKTPPLPIPQHLPSSHFSTVTDPHPPLGNSQSPLLAPHHNFFAAPHPQLAPVFPPQTHPHSPRAPSPQGPQPRAAQSPRLTDPARRFPQYPPHTHFLPMYPRSFSQIFNFPDPSDLGLELPHFPSNGRPGPLQPFTSEVTPELSPFPSDQKLEQLHLPSEPWPVVSPSPSEPKPEVLAWQGTVPMPLDPWPSTLLFPVDPKPMVHFPPNGNLDSFSPPAHAHFPLHSNPFTLPHTLPHHHIPHNLPPTQSRHHFDFAPNVKG